ncbi:unnamed protein product [Arabidopsis halleri]
MNTEVEPPWKRKKTNVPSPPLPSFLSLPDEIVLNCLSRISKMYYPKLFLVSKTFHSLILSIELNYARFLHKIKEPFFNVCLQFPNNPLPSWFTLWIKHDLIDTEKKKSKLVKIPSSYASRSPLFILTVGSEIYALQQYYPPSTVMLVKNTGTWPWRKTPNMIVARANAVACFLHGKIYDFDIKTQIWEPLPDPGPELRFSSIIKKVEVIQRKIYVRSNDNKDSVYDPKKRKWNVINHVLYSCRPRGCLWYDTESKEWKLVKGLSSLNQNRRDGLIETVKYGGKLLILWDKVVQPRRRCPLQDKNIWCALIALEKRPSGQVWGKVEWSNVVLTVPNSYVFLRSSVIRA